MDIGKLIKDPICLIPALASRGLLRWLPDKPYLQLRFYGQMRKKLDLKDPQTFNEKLQWLKLYHRDPRQTALVDKYAAKNFVVQTVGRQYVIPTLGIWDRFADIDFDALPGSFVLKCTHDSGGVVICRDKAHFDKKAAEKKLRKCLKQNYFYPYRERPYKNVKPRIMAEELISDGALPDYKFLCFHGEVKALYVATDRQSLKEETKFDFFDPDFNHLDVRNGHPNAPITPRKPACFEEMKQLAAALSQSFPHLRVDLYEVNGRVYFGELTFCHFGGMQPFDPPRWDAIFGAWLRLPEKTDFK